jgi:cysteine desulfurase
MFFSKPTKKRIYLDHAAATPLNPEVKKAMLPFLENVFGNPSAVHQEGVLARTAVEDARSKIANTLGIRPTGVTFTSGGTESNNLAILGLVKKLHQENGRAYTDMEVITTEIEHPSISEVMPELRNLGVTVQFIKVDSEGKITVPALEAALSPKTVLVTFAYANSEVGVVQSVSRLARVVRRYEKENDNKIFIHVDAAQAPLWLPCQLERLDVDLMSLDVGKCSGPKGVGILATRNNLSVLPILHGGGQEQGQRPGTENVAGIVGAAKALEIAQVTYLQRAEKVALIRDEFVTNLRLAIPEVLLNGPEGENRLANNINISLPQTDTEFAVVYLDTNGVAASTKSACAGAGGGESMVVLKMTSDIERAKSTLRLSLGEETTIEDMKYVINILLKYQQKMQQLTK